MNLRECFKLVFAEKFAQLSLLLFTLILTISIQSSTIVNSLHQVTMIKKSIYLQFINYPFDPILLHFMDNIINVPAFLLIQAFCIYFIHVQLKSKIDPDFKPNKTVILEFLKFLPQGIIISCIYLLFFSILYAIVLYSPLILKILFILLFIFLAPFILISYSENLRVKDALNIKKIFAKIYKKIHLYIYALFLISLLMIVKLIISVIEWRTIYNIFSYGFITNYIGLSILILFLSICKQLYSQKSKDNSLEKSSSKQKKIVIIAFSVIIPIIIIAVPLFAFWYLMWTPGAFWDGPFYGVERMKCPTVKPDQSLKIWDKMTLNVYDKTESDIAPTVQVLDSNQQQQLCIYATESYKDDPQKIGRSRSSVTKIRFSEKYNSTIFYKNPRIKGFVDWSGGPEGAIWIFNRDGKLKQYYFSW